MGTSVMCYLALLTLIVAGHARYSTVLPDNSNDQETPLADPATCSLCGSEGATGLAGAVAGATAVHQVVRSTTRPQPQGRGDAPRPLRRSLDGRALRPDDKSADPAVQPNTMEDGDAAATQQRGLQDKMNEMFKLMDILRRITGEIQLETPAVQPSSAEPSSETREPFYISNPSITTSTTPPPLLEMATEETEGERQRVELRIKEVEARMEKSRRDPSLMGELLCMASATGDTQNVRQLLDNGTDVNYTNVLGYSPLILAFESPRCNSDVGTLLLERGADVNATNTHGRSALHNAALFDRTGFCVSLLLEAGADANARDNDGVTPLHLAAYKNAISVVRELLSAGARKNVSVWSGAWKGITPFLSAKSDGVRDLLHP